MITAATHLLAEGSLFDITNNLSGQTQQTIISVAGAAFVGWALKHFLKAGLVGGLIAVVGGGVLYWGLGNMDYFKDATNKTIKKNNAEATQPVSDSHPAAHAGISGATPTLHWTLPPGAA